VPAPAEFRALVSGDRRGPVASLARAGLRVLEVPYSLAVRWRNHRYDTGRAPIERVDVPVISVGNLTLGGTGKTPTVEWLANWFAARGIKGALVSRGYGARPGRPNDEALELAQKLPDVPHVQDADRVRGARRAIAEFGAELILLDDAFQHRRIARDLDIVLVDALAPDGFGHVFPRGMLREPLSGWSRADVVILTRAELVDTARRAAIRELVRRHAPRAVWAEATHAPQALQSTAGAAEPLATLANQPIAAFCGIGNPAGFHQALANCGFCLLASRELPDHFAYEDADLAELAGWSDALDVAAVVCTGKDLVKVADRWPGKKPLRALTIRLEILTGRPELEARLQPIAERIRRPAPSPGETRG
jgi:tetraacyldisaccharide 4'-kinase